MGKNKGGGR
jgi:parvulin-like peptidyl-prolyl isomerase